MCESCPDCPECGQTIPEGATVEYLVGLVGSPVAFVVLLIGLHHYHPLMADRTFWFVLGAMSFGTVRMVLHDPHVERSIAQWTANEASKLPDLDDS